MYKAASKRSLVIIKLVCKSGFYPLSVERDPDIDKPALPKYVIYKTKWYNPLLSLWENSTDLRCYRPRKIKVSPQFDRRGITHDAIALLDVISYSVRNSCLRKTSFNQCYRHAEIFSFDMCPFSCFDSVHRGDGF